MKPTRVLLTAASTLFVSQVMAGEAVFYITEDGTSMADVAVTVDGTKQLVGKSGFVTFDINSGTHSVELTQYGEWIGDFEFATQANAENAEVQVEVLGGEALEEVLVYTPGQEEAPALGQISGYLESDETGGAVTGARIAITGTEQAVMTDEEGFFAFELPRGEYDIAIAHPNYGKRDVSGVRVMSNVNTGVNLTMSMSGDGVIEEVVAVGSYIPSSATAQQRDASAVLDAIGSEQFSRFGDSDAASALKRVTGVTVADGKYAVVRGLNERYTSVLFNGALVPSPDPTRRVVPLDLFPSGVISSVNVEKTAIANRPADAAGATIDVLTKEAPDEFEGKLSVSLGYADGTTGESVRSQKTSGLELLGFGSSDRDVSGSAKGSVGETTGAGAASLLELSQWETEKVTMSPDMSVELSLGDKLAEYDFGDLAYKVTGRYSNEWEYTESDRANYASRSATTSQEADEYIQYRAVNLIDLSFGGTLTLFSDNYTLNYNALMLRQTQADNIEEVGVRGEDRHFVIDREYTWQEREFNVHQFDGAHYFDEFYKAQVDWGLTLANASLYVPDSRSYNLLADTSTPIDNTFNPLANNLYSEARIDYATKPQRDWTDLSDDSINVTLDGKITPIEKDNYQLQVMAGLSILERDRDVKAHSFQYDLKKSLTADIAAQTDISRALVSQNFTDGFFGVRNNTDANASYEGSWDYSAFYLMPRFEMFDVFIVEAGLRLEDSALEIETSGNSPISAKVEDNDVYPSLNATYFVEEDAQVRFAYSTSVNRPDFREVAPAQFTDSVSGDRYVGNKSLTESTISSIDLRFEYYFSDAESVNVALFRKDFKDAIERTATVISGSSNDVLYSFDNNGDAYAQGIEISSSKDIEMEDVNLRVSGNMSYFDTEIDTFTASGNFEGSRRMQGQPDVLANLQVAVDELEAGREYTLVVNYTGETLSAVTPQAYLEDEFREPRMVVDANFKQPIMDDLDLKLSLKNLTNSEVEETQGGKLIKRYKPGREFKLGVSYLF